MIRLIFRQFNIIISCIFIFILVSFFYPCKTEAKIEYFQDDYGKTNQRSLENLRDVDYQTWQLATYFKNDNQDIMILRIVGFNGSLRLDHPTKLKVQSGIKNWELDDLTLRNSVLANDARGAAAEFELSPLLNDLKNNRPLRLSLQGGFDDLPVPPYVVNEWRSMVLTDLNDDG